jgi:hypothetical protein
LFIQSLTANQSADPFEYPNIHVNYFNVSFDMDVMVAGLQTLRKIFKTPPLRYGVYSIPVHTPHYPRIDYFSPAAISRSGKQFQALLFSTTARAARQPIGSHISSRISDRSRIPSVQPR